MKKIKLFGTNASLAKGSRQTTTAREKLNENAAVQSLDSAMGSHTPHIAASLFSRTMARACCSLVRRPSSACSLTALP